ncbi:MAG: ABC transporter permease [Ignavibacteriaceae bacterium]
MLKNYLKTAFRNILRNKVYSFINIAGLSVGIAACITIFLFVRREYSFDKFNEKADRIYRINVEANLNGKTSEVAVTPAPLGLYLKSEFPQIEHVVRLYAMDMISSNGSPALRYREKVLHANGFILVDSSFFDIFSFKMIQGNPKTALDAPFSVVLTKSAAQRLFGDDNPIGKSIQYNGKFNFTVTGVVQNPLSNSTIQFDYLGSLSSLPGLWSKPNILKSNTSFNYYTYVLLNRRSSVKYIDQRLHGVLSGYWDNLIQSWLGKPKVYLEPLRELYWDNSLEYDIPIKGSRNSVTAFAIIAVIIFLIACMNFINLYTARSLTRAKEVGIRKVVGGQRIQLVRQFMLESGLMSFIALLVAIALNELFIPIVNSFLGTTLQINYLNDITIIFIIVGIWVMTSLLSGMIPAFYISSFQPISTLKGNLSGMTGKRFNGQFFVLFQFSAATTLIFCTIVVTNQYNLLISHDVGFNKENIIVLKCDQTADGYYNQFKQRLLQNAAILGVTDGDAIPGNTFGKGPYFFNGRSGMENLMFSFGVVDPDYIKVFDMKLLAGRNFSWNIQSDKYNAFILNDAAVKKIGWRPQEAIGKPFSYFSDSLKGQVVGVLNNFNFKPLQYHVEPLVLMMGNSAQSLAVKISSNDVASTLGFIKSTWEVMFPNSPIEYSFLDKSLDTLYKSEKKLGMLFTWFSLLSIVISCLGLYGLSLYTGERKTKEIGIRKVIGASVWEIVILLSKEFVKWVLISNLIAWPLAYYIMSKWLQDFAYRTNISPWIFIASSVLSLIIALLTLILHVIKAATVNPVESLRYE